MIYLLNMSKIIWFRDCHHGLQELVGGKNSSLGELYNLSQRLDLNIADGFAITTRMYNNFLEYNHLDDIIKDKLSTLDCDNLEQLQAGSKYLQDLFHQARFSSEDSQVIINSFESLSSQYSHPIQVAVRSSAVAEDLSQCFFCWTTRYLFKYF